MRLSPAGRDRAERSSHRLVVFALVMDLQGIIGRCGSACQAGSENSLVSLHLEDRTQAAIYWQQQRLVSLDDALG